MKKVLIFFILSCLLVIAAFFCFGSELTDNRLRLRPESAVSGTISESTTSSGKDRQSYDLQVRQLKVKQMAIAMQHMKKTLEDAHLSDEPSDEELSAAYYAGAEQAEWRDTWVSEIHNEEWSQRMEGEIRTMANSLPDSEINVHQLSCRKTVCRMFLQIKGKRNATEFSLTKRNNPEFDFGFQLLNPDRENEETEEDKVYNYELIVKRKIPTSV